MSLNLDNMRKAERAFDRMQPPAERPTVEDLTTHQIEVAVELFIEDCRNSSDPCDFLESWGVTCNDDAAKMIQEMCRVWLINSSIVKEAAATYFWRTMKAAALNKYAHEND